MNDIVGSNRRAPADLEGTPGDGDVTRVEPDLAANISAFVIQLTRYPTPDVFCGRVQHLATLDGGNFSSPDALIAIMRRVLERRPARDPTDDD